MERRSSTRIPFKASAEVHHNGRVIPSEIRNISKHGFFVSTRGIRKTDSLTFVTISLRHGERNLSLTLPCEVARVSGTGIGCRCGHLDPETLLFICNLLSTHSSQAEFLDSFYRHLNMLEFEPQRQPEPDNVH
jgi:hypothetical protein